ncbi:uncharacterized protein LOC142542685 [Primulina tabacum]|uniref:uncharacterized protein LOC142542685 n=1 Tax=Primulina tabacum TaxID=48773 RepID=UPI003F59B473
MAIPMKTKKPKMANSKNKDPHLISISINPCRIRVKFPKILAKSKHKGSQSSEYYKNRENGQKIRKELPKGIGTIISSACGSRNAKEMLVYTSDDEEESTEEKETVIFEEDELALANIDKQGRRENDDENHKKQIREVSDQSLLKSSSFTRIFRKSNGFHLKKWKKVKADNDMLYGTKQAGIKASYARIRNLEIGGKRTMIQGEKPKDEEEEDERQMELCKKRILMGEKCRPLNVSGALHYDEAGILLPEDVIPNEKTWDCC